MKEFLKTYKNPNEESINYGLMNREHDADLVEYIINSCKSLEVLEYIEFVGYREIEDERQIDLNQYMVSRRKTKRKSDTKYMYLQDSRYKELQLTFRIRCKGQVDIVQKNLLIPVADENGYYTIKGKKYLLLYQLVDASTYTTRNGVTHKSLMPVSIKRESQDYTDTEGSSYNAPTYKIFMFKRDIDILMFYFAKVGVKKALKYFDVHEIIKFVDSERDRTNNVYFQISSKMYIEVNRYFFLKYTYVQSLTFMILNIVSNRLTFDDLEDKRYWIEKIGSLSATNAYGYYDKGVNTLVSFDRMLDETTKSILKLDKSNKKNIYAAVRWMVQNYSDLRKKDNLDLANKRLRCNEYVASLLTKAFSDRVNRIILLGNRVTIEKVKEIFKFPGNIIMQQLYTSGLLRFDDRINDMDFFSKFRFTLKGPNSLGGKNDKNIAMKYRGIHPSYIGRIDINVCGTSDPGSSGIITPFCETDGLYFDGGCEPQGGVFDYQKESRKHIQEQNPDMLYVDLYQTSENVNELFATHDKLVSNMRQMQVKKTPRRNDMYYIDINVGDDEEEI